MGTTGTRGVMRGAARAVAAAGLVAALSSAACEDGGTKDCYATGTRVNSTYECGSVMVNEAGCRDWAWDPDGRVCRGYVCQRCEFAD